MSIIIYAVWEDPNALRSLKKILGRIENPTSVWDRNGKDKTRDPMRALD